MSETSPHRVAQTRKKRLEAEHLLRQVERKIEMQEQKERRQGMKSSQMEEVNRRRDGIIKERNQAQRIIAARRLQEEQRKYALKEAEKERKEQSRNSMYTVFADRLNQAKDDEGRGGWIAAKEDAKLEKEAMEIIRRENAAEQKETHRRRKLRAIEEIEKNREGARVSRHHEQALCNRLIQARTLQRARTAEGIVQQTHQLHDAAKRGRLQLEIEKQEERQRQCEATEREEARALAKVTKRLSALQNYESRR